MISSNFIFIFTKFCVIVSFLFSTLVRAAAVATLVILSILFLTSIILGLRVVSVAKLAISGISSSTFFISALYTSF